MKFGKTLRQSIYGPWKDKYIDYTKLKNLLRDDADEDDDKPWTEEDENRFCDEIFNTQLEKVAKFQQERVDELKERVEATFDELREIAPAPEADGEEAPKPKGDAATARLRKLEAECDKITNEIRELKRYSSINYTGFLKIVKKHDRKRGDRYKVRPMMQLSLSQRPFNSEQGYSPLLNKLSLIYYAIRQSIEEGDQAPLDLDANGETHNGERYTAHKFWIHPDNLLEVQTLILRRLPSLVYSEQAAKELDASTSPPITSLYFDNKNFELYGAKVDQESEATSMRLRWYGQLSARPDIYVEKKTIDSSGTSKESKFVIKEKHIKPFIHGEDITEKPVAKMERQGQPAEKVDAYKNAVQEIQDFVKEKKLSPTVRANYVRTAFQKPADDRVRISIDANLAFIREDTLDAGRPCRDPSEWHRTDIDTSNMTYPFKHINQSEVSKFPYAVLDIKLRDDGSGKRPGWVEDLMSSHLVHPTPRFSKFVHGVASLFEDYVNTLPFWLSDIETDIRKDPQTAFEEEEQRKAQRADDAQAVGSLIGHSNMPSSYKAAKSSPVAKSYLADRMAAESSARLSQSLHGHRASLGAGAGNGEEQGETSGRGAQQPRASGGYGTLSAVMPSFSLSKYAMARGRRASASRPLPEGVVEPTEWIKNAGELKIEPKVWLANERTFLKWQHISLLQGSLAVALYAAAGTSGNRVAEAMGMVYVLIAAFSGLWGWHMQRTRRTMIMERSGKDFDNMVGPIIVSAALMVALITNFVLQYQAAFGRYKEGELEVTELV